MNGVYQLSDMGRVT